MHRGELLCTVRGRLRGGLGLCCRRCGGERDDLLLPRIPKKHGQTGDTREDQQPEEGGSSLALVPVVMLVEAGHSYWAGFFISSRALGRSCSSCLIRSAFTGWVLNQRSMTPGGFFACPFASENRFQKAIASAGS